MIREATTVGRMTFSVFEGSDGQFYVRAHAANGEPWFTSEGYTTRGHARRSALDFVTHMRSGGTVEVVDER